VGGGEGGEGRGEVLEVVVGEEAEGGGEVGSAGDFGAAASVMIMTGEAVQFGQVVGELLGWGEGKFGLGFEGGEGEAEGADLEGAEVVVGDAGTGLGGEASGVGGGVEFDEGWKRRGGRMIVAGVVAGLAAVLGEEGLAEGNGLRREIEYFAFLKGGGDAAGVEVGGDVSGLGGTEVLGGHAAAGAGG
jgi:hypothetical protein